jgi:pimeloyl-ACP methyl ester carboxylesterase
MMHGRGDSEKINRPSTTTSRHRPGKLGQPGIAGDVRRMRHDEARKVPVGDLALNVWRGGTGPAVLLLHGFPDSLDLWRHVAPRLVASGHDVIAPDLRGFGESDAPVGRRYYAMDRILGDLTGLLDVLGVKEPAHVVGHDWGAVVAWCLAMAHPERVRSSTVISVGHPREYTLSGLEQKWKGRYVFYWQLAGVAEASLSRNDFAGLRRWLVTHPDADACVRDVSRPGRLTAGLNYYRANLRRVLFGAWPECRVPTLGIWSSGDNFLAEDQMVKSSRRVAAPWRYERIDGAAHWLPLEAPERIANLALDWFRRN